MGDWGDGWVDKWKDGGYMGRRVGGQMDDG